MYTFDDVMNLDQSLKQWLTWRKRGEDENTETLKNTLRMKRAF